MLHKFILYIYKDQPIVRLHKVIKSIYGDDGGFKEFNRRGRSFGGEKWCDILRVGNDIEKTGIHFCSSFGLKVGNGYKYKVLVRSMGQDYLN